MWAVPGCTRVTALSQCVSVSSTGVRVVQTLACTGLLSCTCCVLEWQAHGQMSHQSDTLWHSVDGTQPNNGLIFSIPEQDLF